MQDNRQQSQGLDRSIPDGGQLVSRLLKVLSPVSPAGPPAAQADWLTPVVCCAWKARPPDVADAGALYICAKRAN